MIEMGVKVLDFKNVNLKSVICRLSRILFFVLIPFATFCQLKEQLNKYKNWDRFNQIYRLYQLNNFQFAWIENKNAQSGLLNILNSVDSFGLNTADYRFQFFKTYTPGQTLKNLGDSVDVDIHFTDAAIHFFTELKFGNKSPSFGYAGLKYNPSVNNDIPDQLLRYLKTGSLNDFVSAVDLKTIEYKTMIDRLHWFLQIVHVANFKDAKIVSKQVDGANTALLTRLYQLGITDSILKTNEKKIILENIKKAQGLFDVLNDGVLRSTSIQAFNISLTQRIDELKIALNYLRWVDQIKQTSSVLLLNIPSAYLMVYDQGKIVLDSKVIVGKPATPTPTVTSTITQVILYPFWNVPHKIATKELLPSIKENIDFLEAGNYQVLNNDGVVLNPYKINWSNLSAGYFPYHIRQSTGCDNSLGIVKFEFYNPFTVYLHDTPSKGLFSFNKRYFSHGCMRVEKPIELAHLLLGRNRIAIDTLTAKGCLNQQAPKPVVIEKELSVIILYSTVWYNKEGVVKFYDDVYNKLNR